MQSYHVFFVCKVNYYFLTIPNCCEIVTKPLRLYYKCVLLKTWLNKTML